MKLFILGYGAKNRSKENPSSTGKDYLAARLYKDLGLKFESSSWFACKEFIFDKLKQKEGYKTLEECYNDRHRGGNRKVWYDLICEYNEGDPSRLARKIFETNDIYVGLRNKIELADAQAKVDTLSIWVDASQRIGPETSDSITVTSDMCDFIIENNGSLEQFDIKLDKLVFLLKGKL